MVHRRQGVLSLSLLQGGLASSPYILTKPVSPVSLCLCLTNHAPAPPAHQWISGEEDSFRRLLLLLPWRRGT